MSNTIVVGLAFGDCAKAAVTDRLAPKHSIVARFNGTSNAGHTVVVGDIKYVTHIIPSGVISGIPSHIGRGCVISPQKFYMEAKTLIHKGVSLAHLTIDENCHLVTDEHIAEDNTNEDANPIGSTRQGSAPAYAAKYGRKSIRVKDITSSDLETWQYLKSFAVPSTYMLDKDNVLFEGAQSTLLDIGSDYFPYVTSSHCVADFAAVGTGMSLLNKKVEVIGVFKAYTTSVSKGPFPTSMEASHPVLAASIRAVGKEWGATTGRPRQIGWLDLVATKQAVKLNGCTQLAMNKSDVLNGLGNINVCVSYESGVPVYVPMPGWRELNSPEFDDFTNAVEEYIGVPIKYIGTGPGRDEVIVR